MKDKFTVAICVCAAIGYAAVAWGVWQLLEHPPSRICVRIDDAEVRQGLNDYSSTLVASIEPGPAGYYMIGDHRCDSGFSWQRVTR